MQAAYPELKKVQGTVVNMSSMMAGAVKTSQMAYNTSKSMQDAVSCRQACKPPKGIVVVVLLATCVGCPSSIAASGRICCCLQVTKHHAMLYARDGVRVNSVNPGYVLTDVYGELQLPMSLQGWPSPSSISTLLCTLLCTR